jgi:hypothetical protein
MHRDDSTLLDLQKSTGLAVQFLGDLDMAIFMSDAKTQSAALHQLLLLGKGVKRLSPAFRDAHDGMPWRLMAGIVVVQQEMDTQIRCYALPWVSPKAHAMPIPAVAIFLDRLSISN